MTVRASQVVIEALIKPGASGLHASQAALEVLIRSAGASRRASQSLLEALIFQPALGTGMRVSQLLLEILVWSYTRAMPNTFPTLPGLTYSVIKRPKFYTGIATAASGREVRVAYAVNPLWEWDLTFSYLPDMQTATSLTVSDFRQLIGFFLSQVGALSGFLFLDPDDNTLIGQAIGTTDGTSTTWQIVRTFGGSDGVGTEPVGYIDSTYSFHLYRNGSLVDPSTYDLLSTTPVNQQVRFHVAPTSGDILTVTMRYFYYVRFKDDHNDYEKFMDRLWSVSSLTLMSQRG